jgi:ParB family chromosome partitioning protein
MSEEFHLTQEHIAAAVGKDRASVANHLRLLKLPAEIRADVAAGTLSMGHARALLGLPGAAEQRRVANEVLARALSVRETESLVKKVAEGATPAAAPREAAKADVHTRAAEERLRMRLGTRVRIVRHGARGRIEIDFASEDELIRLFDHLAGDA